MRTGTLQAAINSKGNSKLENDPNSLENRLKSIR